MKEPGETENELAAVLELAAFFQDDYTKKLPVIAAFRRWRGGAITTDEFLALAGVLVYEPVPPMRGLEILNDYRQAKLPSGQTLVSDENVRPVTLTMDREKREGDLRIHPYMFVVFDDVRVRVCADSWCTGNCLHPAAVIVIPNTVENIGGREYKLFGDMVAMGRVTQPWRGTWTGAKVIIPSTYWDYLSQRWWH